LQRPDAFLFDMDGVILDSEPIHSRVKMDTFHHFGLTFDENRLVHYMGRTSEVIFGEAIEAQHRTDLTLKEVVDYKHDRYLEVLHSGVIDTVPGSLELIRTLHEAGIPLALATSSWEVVMNIVLDRLDLRPFFTSVLSGSQLPESKPNPAIYTISADRLGVKPERCIVVEDAETGILAAKRAGAFCVAFRNPHSGAQDLSLADTVVDDLAEIPKLIGIR